jgi:hypothetical protein
MRWGQQQCIAQPKQMLPAVFVADLLGAQFGEFPIGGEFAQVHR